MTAIFDIASASCSNDDKPEDDIIYDFNPFYISTMVANANGENMLDSTSAGYDSAFVHNSYATFHDVGYFLPQYRLEPQRATIQAILLLKWQRLYRAWRGILSKEAE